MLTALALGTLAVVTVLLALAVGSQHNQIQALTARVNAHEKALSALANRQPGLHLSGMVQKILHAEATRRSN